MPLGGSRLPDGPLGGSRPPSTFGGDYLGGGSPGGDEGCNGSPGDGFPSCGCLTAAAPTAKSSAAAVPIFSAAAIPQAFPAATTSSGARVRLGVDLSEWPPFLHLMRCCPVPVRPTSTTRGRRTGAPSDTRAWPHTQTHTREGRIPSGPERTRGHAASTTRTHDPVREPPSYQGLPFSFTHLAGQLEHRVLKHGHQEFMN